VPARGTRFSQARGVRASQAANPRGEGELSSNESGDGDGDGNLTRLRGGATSLGGKGGGRERRGMAGSEFRQPRLGFATPRDPVWQGCRGFRHEHSGIAPRLCSRTPSRMIMGDISPLIIILSSLRFLQMGFKWEKMCGGSLYMIVFK
jgi:hypothetical protein